MNEWRGNKYDIEEEPTMLVIMIIKDIRVMIRLCSPLPAAPVKFDNRTAMARLETAMKDLVKNVDSICLIIC